MIRRATDADIDDIVWLAHAMVEESPLWDEFDPAQMRLVLSNVIGGQGAVFVAELPGRDLPAGVVAAFLTKRPFSGQLFVADLALYVRPEHRLGRMAKRLVDVLEAWAREEGAVEIQLGVSSGIHPKKTGALYRSWGYGLLAEVFVKHL